MAEDIATVLILSEADTSALAPVVAAAGHRVVEAVDGDQMLQIGMRGKIHVAILPVDAEPIGGEELLHLICRLTSAAIIAVGPPRETEMVSALFHGADAYFPRPVDANMLVIRLRTLLRRELHSVYGHLRRGGTDDESASSPQMAGSQARPTSRRHARAPAVSGLIG